jgi:hypothetical protein
VFLLSPDFQTRFSNDSFVCGPVLVRSRAAAPQLACKTLWQIRQSKLKAPRPRHRFYFEEPGGNFLNNLSTPLFRFSMFLLELLESVSLALPLHISCFVLVSNRSTTSVPT